MPFLVPSSVRGYLREPAIPDPPRRVWRDWALVGAASLTAVLEAVLRTDDDWTALTVGWQVAALIAFFVGTPPALLLRRTRPLFATAYGFTIAIGFSVALAIGDAGGDAALVSFAVLLVVPYALYRWGSGRDGAIGGVILVAAGILGNLTAPQAGLGDWVGGFIVLSIPVELGLIVRYRRTARERALREAKAREREQLARELHDTVAHHVSAIAVQAQAARAVAATDPDRALEVLEVIEGQATRTLAEMRAMVGTLRDSADSGLAPQQGIADLPRLASSAPGDLAVVVEIDAALEGVGPAVDAAIYRIAQESVTNAARHARHATRVDVRVAPAGDLVRLTVLDDGRTRDGDRPPGYGLLGMAERASLLGGRLSAGPAEGRGWRVTAELPRSEVRG